MNSLLWFSHVTKKQLRQKSSPSCVGGVACEWRRADPVASRYAEVYVQANMGAWWPAGSGEWVTTRGKLSYANRWGKRESEQLWCGGSVVEPLRYFASRLLAGLDARAPGWGGAKHGAHIHSREDTGSRSAPAVGTDCPCRVGRTRVARHPAWLLLASPGSCDGSLTPQNPVVVLSQHQTLSGY